MSEIISIAVEMIDATTKKKIKEFKSISQAERNLGIGKLSKKVYSQKPFILPNNQLVILKEKK